MRRVSLQVASMVLLFSKEISAAIESAATVVAKPTVHVGDAIMDGSILSEYDNVWRVRVRYNDGRIDDRGLSSDHVRFRQIDGKRYLTRTEGTTAVIGKPGAMPTSGYSMTFNVFDPTTLKPLIGESRSSTGDAITRTFDGAHVSTRTRPAPGAADSVVDSDTAEAVFDVEGGMTGLLLASLPLRSGYIAVLAGMGDVGMTTTPIHVVGEETIQAGHVGKRKTWVVEIGASPSKTTYWVSKTVPYVIRVTVKASNAVASWEMLP